jgi:16S rRNA (uracil1498-N3)-methyltransferase
MQRYFLETFNSKITGQDAHHIKKVMRMNVGDEIIVCHNGHCFLSSISGLEPEVTYTIKHELKKPKSLDITVIQGQPKHPKSEAVVKYATIFGASEIILTTMQRSIAKIDSDSNKLKRLETIAKEASELAHRFDIPKIKTEKNILNMDLSLYDLVLLADESEKAVTLEKALSNDFQDLKIAVIIGPEGGISDSERKALLSKNVVAITLGSNILPTEVASLYVLSYLSAKNA